MMARPGMRFRWKLTISLTLALTLLSFWLLIRGRPIGFPQRDKSKSNRPNEISDLVMLIGSPAIHADSAANQSSSTEPRSNHISLRFRGVWPQLGAPINSGGTFDLYLDQLRTRLGCRSSAAN